MPGWCGCGWQWDETENKSQVFVYGGAAVVGLWLSSTIVGAINSIPLLPKLMELVGLGYTSWFVYRYLLFKVRVRRPQPSFLALLRCQLIGTLLAV